MGRARAFLPLLLASAAAAGAAEQGYTVVAEQSTVRIHVGKTGVFPFYCTNFCSALHQEMSGYLAVRPR